MSELPTYCHSLLAAKAATALTFDDIAKAIGKPEVWTTALFFGQARCDEETAKKITEVLKMASGEDSVVSGLAGKGDGSFGVSGMVVRGGTWDGPPKVSRLVYLSHGRMLMGRTPFCTDCTKSWLSTDGVTKLSSRRR